MNTPHVLDLFTVGVFAVSGCLAAGRKSLDLIGVLVIAVVTAVGGGTRSRSVAESPSLFWTADPNFLYVIAGLGRR